MFILTLSWINIQKTATRHIDVHVMDRHIDVYGMDDRLIDVFGTWWDRISGIVIANIVYMYYTNLTVAQLGSYIVSRGCQSNLMISTHTMIAVSKKMILTMSWISILVSTCQTQPANQISCHSLPCQRRTNTLYTALLRHQDSDTTNIIT